MRYFVTEYVHHYAQEYTQAMFLIERSANRQVAFKFGKCPMRLMPFAPDNLGSIFIDNSFAKSTTHAKQRFATVFEILTCKRMKLTIDKSSIIISCTDDNSLMQN